MNKQTISRKQAVEMIHKKQNEHNVFTVTFRKKDGEMRKLNARFNVTSHLHTDGSGKDTTAHKDNIYTVFDMQKGAYRKFNVDTMTEMCLNKEHYLIVD